MATPNLGLPTTAGKATDISVPYNQAMQIIDAVNPLVLQDITLTTPPTTTSGDVGKRWAVAATATGAWTGKEAQIAMCTAADVWQFIVPVAGWRGRNLADDTYYAFNGTAWVNDSAEGAITDAPVDGQQYVRKDGAWDVVDIPEGTAEATSYDNTTSGLGAGNVQAAIDELSTEKLDDAPSDGEGYVRKDGAWEIATVGGGGGTGAMELVREAVVGAATTSIQFTGLDLDTDYQYVLEIDQVPNATGAQNLAMFFNGDTTVGNYPRQRTGGDGSTTSSARVADANIGGHIPNAVTLSMKIQVRLTKVAGQQPMAHIQYSGFASANIVNHINGFTWSNTANVTSITLTSSIANGFGVGSVVRLYRVNGSARAQESALVADITVATAQQDIDIVGLDLDRDCEYEIELCHVANGTSVSEVFMYYNGDTTAANYMRQYNSSFGSSAFADRASTAKIWGEANAVSSGDSSIGLIRVQKVVGKKPWAYCAVSSNDSATTIYTSHYTHKWNSTANVTSIKLRNSGMFGVGTRVRVWKRVRFATIFPVKAWYTNPSGGSSSTAYAVKGNVFIPVEDVVIDAVLLAAAEVSGQSYHATIYRVNNSGVIQEIVADVGPILASASAVVGRTWTLPAPITLAAGNTYVIAHRRVSATGTTSSGLRNGSFVSTPGPFQPETGYAYYTASVTPAVSDTFTIGSGSPWSVGLRAVG